MKRCSVFLLTLCCLFTLLIHSASAIEPPYQVSRPYERSTYHRQLLTLPATGDLAFDTVSVALSQVGYHEGNSQRDLGGKNRGGSRNYTEYNYAYGTVGGSYSYAWCAAFVTWCLREAGAAHAAGAFVSCTLWVEHLKNAGLYRPHSSGYTPKEGDLIFFRSAGTARASDHIGLVRYVKDGKVYTVEGNSSDRVNLCAYDLSDRYIAGYGLPDYEGAHIAINHGDTFAGFYTVTNEFLHVRSTPSTAGKLLGKLSFGEMVEVVEIKNGWGRILYGGKPAFISLNYADFAAPLLYEVTFSSELDDAFAATLSSFSFEEKVLEITPPEEAGFRFSHWEDGEGNRYRVGEKLPRKNLLLTAVYTEVPPAENGVETPVIPPNGVENEGGAPLLPPAPQEENPISPAVAAARREAATVFALLLSLFALYRFITGKLL